MRSLPQSLNSVEFLFAAISNNSLKNRPHGKLHLRKDNGTNNASYSFISFENDSTFIQREVEEIVMLYDS